jgi:putative oxidoreductase
LQRLFTTFAHGWPGFGLLVQRLVAGAILILQASRANAFFESTTTIAAPISAAVGTVLAIFIMIGLWTPLAGTLVVGFEVWIAYLHPGNPATEILLAGLGATLAMIGPGAWSIDSQLFGRKHIGG